MIGRKYIVDIRRHRGTDSSYVIELVGRFCAGSPGAVVEWLVRPDQAHLIQPDRIIGQADPLDHSWTPRICDRLVQSSATQNGGTGAPFWVLSYDNFLLMQAQKLNTEKQPVTSVHIGELYKMNFVPHERFWGRSQSVQRPGNGFGYRSGGSSEPCGVPSPLPIEEAIDIAKQILRGGQYTSQDNPLPQKELRPRMSGIDGRAARQVGHPTSENLIADLVDRGLQEGWLKRFRGTPGKTGTELIYLVEKSSASPKETELVQPKPSVGGDTEDETLAPVVLAHTPSPSETPDTAQPTTIPVRVAVDSPRRPPKHQNRATEFEAVLSKSRIGAIPETRELLFDVLEGVVFGLNGQPVLVTELFSRAIRCAQEKALETGYVSEKNWPAAERCIRRLMLWAGVMMGDDGNPISDKIGSNSRRIISLLPDFRRVCEAYLVEHIIEKMSNIKYDDDPYYLGLTLYRRGKERAVSPEKLKDRADAILEYLEQSGRIELDADRAVRIRSARKVLSMAN